MDKVNFLRKKSGDFTQIYALPKINQNEFDNYDNYNLNLLLIKRIILRSRKQGSTHAPLMNSNTSQRIENSQDKQESGTCPRIPHYSPHSSFLMTFAIAPRGTQGQPLVADLRQFQERSEPGTCPLILLNYG